MTETSARKPIPKRLDEELKNIPKFKPRVEPARRTVADILGESVERAAYDEILGPLINRRPSTLTKIAGGGYSSKPPSDLSSESDFTTTLLTRLADAEAEAKSMRKQLVEKIARLTSVEHENIELRAVVDAPSHLINELNHYKTENYHLEKQIVDMEEFLHDYGLQWVGNSSSSRNTARKDENHDSVSGTLNYHDFSMKIEELNSMLSSEPSQIKTDSEAKRARIVHASELFDSIRITYYNDGIMIRRGPFRDQKSPSFGSFVRDVMDGFFPSEFRDEFPDGVMFHLIDRHNTDHLGSKDHSDGAMSKEQLLGKIPKTVVKNGNIVSVRQDLTNFINGKNNDDSSSGARRSANDGETRDSGGVSKLIVKSGPVVLKTEAYLIKEENDTLITGEGNIESDIGEGMKMTASVQIKWIDGFVLIALMFEEHSVRNIRQELKAHAALSGSGSEEFELRSAYPPRVLSDDMTLQDAGLLPNGTIHARRIFK